jgi:hypothetical protein
MLCWIVLVSPTGTKGSLPRNPPGQDTLNGNDVKDRLLVVKVVRRYPTDSNYPTRKQSDRIKIMAIICIIAIMHINNMCNSNNFHFQDHQIFPGLKQGHNRRAWIQCRSQQEQRTGETLEHYRSIPYYLRRYDKSSIIDARRPNNDGVHAITSIEHFAWKWIAVNPLHTLVLGVSHWQHQTIERCKMALVFGRFLAAPMSEGGKLPAINGISLIMRISVKGKRDKIFFNIFLLNGYCLH